MYDPQAAVPYASSAYLYDHYLRTQEMPSYSRISYISLILPVGRRPSRFSLWFLTDPELLRGRRGALKFPTFVEYFLQTKRNAFVTFFQAAMA